jgi:hypothetical protein
MGAWLLIWTVSYLYLTTDQRVRRASHYDMRVGMSDNRAKWSLHSNWAFWTESYWVYVTPPMPMNGMLWIMKWEKYERSKCGFTGTKVSHDIRAGENKVTIAILWVESRNLDVRNINLQDGRSLLHPQINTALKQKVAKWNTLSFQSALHVEQFQSYSNPNVVEPSICNNRPSGVHHSRHCNRSTSTLARWIRSAAPMCGWTDELVDGRVNRLIAVWPNGWTDGWTDGLIGGWVGDRIATLVEFLSRTVTARWSGTLWTTLPEIDSRKKHRYFSSRTFQNWFWPSVSFLCNRYRG